jgi:hypothetical protein
MSSPATVLTTNTEHASGRGADAAQLRRREQLLDRIEKSLSDGDSIDIQNRQYRYLRRGQVLIEGDDELEALENAVYGRMPRHQGNQLIGYVWGKFVDLGDARAFFQRELDSLSPSQREALFVQLVYRATMRPSPTDTLYTRQGTLSPIAGDDLSARYTP